MNILLLLILSFVIGTLYYYMMEKSLPIYSNCSFTSSIWTDILAFIWGFIVIYKGYKYKDSLLILLASTVIVEHIWQLFPKKSFQKLVKMVVLH